MKMKWNTRDRGYHLPRVIGRLPIILTGSAAVSSRPAVARPHSTRQVRAGKRCGWRFAHSRAPQNENCRLPIQVGDKARGLIVNSRRASPLANARTKALWMPTGLSRPRQLRQMRQARVQRRVQLDSPPGKMIRNKVVIE